MKCTHCKSEWNTSREVSVSITNCPFCEKPLLPEKINATTLEDVLVEVNRCFGSSILTDEEKLIGLILDLAPHLSNQINFLKYFLKCGAAKKLVYAKDSSAQDQFICAQIIIRNMKDDMFIDEAASRRICDAFLFAASGHHLMESASVVTITKQHSQTDLPSEQKHTDSITSHGNNETVAQSNQQQRLHTQPVGSRTVASPWGSELTPDEQFKKGEAFYNGLSEGKAIPKDYAKAFDWYNKAADRGHALAQCQLGLLYRDGHGVPKDEKLAFAWFVKAAHVSQNCPRGKFYVGSCYERGTGVSQDYKEAVRWYTIAAEQGDAYAQINLALCYKFGSGVERNYAEAVRLLSLAASQGDALAQCHLGLLYKEGKGVPKDLVKAFDYINQSASQKEPYGQLQLGYCYWQGEGVERDHAKAFTWFKMAAEQGDDEAQERVGFCYENGKGIDQSSFQAVKWYEKAVAQGNARAMASLGDCYSEGKGVLQNSEKATSLFEMAYLKGELIALEPLLWEYAVKDILSEAECKHIISLTTPKVAGDNIIDEIDAKIIDLCIVSPGYNIALDMLKYASTKTAGIQWMRKCAEGGNASAQRWLGDTYRLGDDLPKDREKAIYWYNEAAAQGDKDAAERLKMMKRGVLGRLFT